MNKELILKYEAEFKHWLRGGKLLGRFNFTNIKNYKPEPWFEFEETKWSLTSFEYLSIIIEDEYVEFRKALAEGKILQLNEAEKFGDPKRGWVDLSCTDLGHSSVLFPVEYYRIKPEESKRNTFKVCDWVHIPSLDDSIPCQFSEDLCCLGLALWKPKIGEWVIPDTGIDDKMFVVMKYDGVSLIADRCQPFIGELPK